MIFCPSLDYFWNDFEGVLHLIIMIYVRSTYKEVFNDKFLIIAQETIVLDSKEGCDKELGVSLDCQNSRNSKSGIFVSKVGYIYTCYMNINPHFSIDSLYNKVQAEIPSSHALRNHKNDKGNGEK